MAVTQIQQFFLLLSVTFARSDELRFLILGDWGGMELSPYTTSIERAVSISETAERLGTHFTIALGKAM